MITTKLDKTGINVYTLSNKNGMEVDVIGLGAAIVNIRIPSKAGVKDVVLGFDDLNMYNVNPAFFGICVGPVANRTANAKLTIDGVEYSLPVNENSNNLHTDFDKGLHKRVFGEKIDGEKVVFDISLEDMEYGLPGNRKFTVIYELTDDNMLSIEYKMISDKKTIINPTNHTYFNLGGHNSGSILDSVVKLNCDNYTPVSSDLIPVEIAPVSGTPFDFTSEKSVGKEINEDNLQLKLGGGYDHNFVINDNSNAIAVVRNDKTGISMEVFTDLPGVQFYTGNNIGVVEGKEGTTYVKNSGLCLETQYFPNSANDKRFKSPIIEANKEFYSKTGYRFSF
ncbi:MAG: galactose mutarotase [Clostridia bacterium]|nr:galactose mutarotase [Clostridia bacterium]